jgi:hypothetical protein
VAGPRPWLALALTLLASAARAQEWHEAYRNGVRALADGQAQRAVTLLEYAASQHPRPGRNVITYGTNVEPRYYPYLRLAEAYLRLNDLAGARSALKRSESWGLEPAPERSRLAGEVEAAAARAAPAAPVAAPTVSPPATPVAVATPTPTPTSPPATSVAPAVEPPPPAATATLAPSPASPGAVSRPAPGPRPSPPPSPPLVMESRPAEAPAGAATATLEVVSQPPGATVYLDDSLIGTTDPEWGRLVTANLAPGRHRLRLSRPGHVDVIEDIELRAGSVTDVRRRLGAAGLAPGLRLVLSAAIVLALVGLTVWALRRPRTAAPAAAAPSSRFDSLATPARGTPEALRSPGAVRDADGVEHFGEYRLLEPLGRGGMASVYKAERRGELCALKRPLAAFLDEPQFRERFLREAEIGRTLHHPNIVRILERGEIAGVPYFTMELIAGETLQALLQRAGPLAPRAAAGLVAQVGEALDYAHLKGVVHRDLKPSNIMVEADGTARVMDYGIARARRFEGLTVTGSFLGTPEYVAPEAIEGKGTDARSDLYSLGVVFYETLTGARPFSADTPFAVLRRQLTDPPTPPASLRPGLPPELERIILRLLNKRPEERYAGAEELVLELRDFLNRAA